MDVDSLMWCPVLHWVLKLNFSVSLSLGSNQILSDALTNLIVMEESFTLAHEFFIDANNVNVSLMKGDLVSLQIDVIHDCAQTGVLWWDTYDAITGIEFNGEMIYILN